MGKRKSERLPGGDGKSPVPRTKRSPQEDLEATEGDSFDVTGPALTRDTEGKPKPAAGGAGDQAERTHGSATANAPGSADGDGEAAAPEQSREGERVSCPSPQEGGNTGIGGGGTSPEAAASQPESPQRANSAVDETEEAQPVASTEQRGSAGEELDAETQTPCRTGSIGESPRRGSAAPAQGEGAAGSEIALPADTPGRSSGVLAAVPDPHREEGANGSEAGERRGDADQSWEAPGTSVVNTEENEPGAVAEGAAGGEHRETVSGEQPPRAAGMNDAVQNAAESRCSPAGGIVSPKVLGVCTLSAEPKAEGGSAKAESAGAAGTAGPVSWPQSGNASPRKTSGEADMSWEVAGRGGPPFPGTSSALDPATPAIRNPEGPGEEEGAEARGGAEHAASAPRTEAQPHAGSGFAETAPALTAMPGPAPTGTASPHLAAGADPRDETSWAGEQKPPLWGVREGRTPEPPPRQPLPAPPLAEGEDAEQPRPRGEEPEGLRPPAHREDATDVICGLILELSNLNRLVMSAHRGLEALRRSKPRRSRRSGSGTATPRARGRWKEA